LAVRPTSPRQRATDTEVSWKGDSAVQNDGSDVQIDLDAVHINLDAIYIDLDAVPIDLDELHIDLDAIPIDLDELHIDLDAIHIDLDELHIDLDAVPIDLDAIHIDLDAIHIDLDGDPYRSGRRPYRWLGDSFHPWRGVQPSPKVNAHWGFARGNKRRVLTRPHKPGNPADPGQSPGPHL
jgi:hypothetical protein